ncbi:IS630 transposase-related protein [Leptolyngbya sp. ST-U4]|uniref:IS630 transposase-related protein n=1 Tax=Leptolyngbya sp. ST-U4 TaxID=2933912 RepID=UPI003298DA9B
MPSPYSDDLRQKVLDAIDIGYCKTHVSRLFNISRNTIDLWLKRREETGSVSAIRAYRRGPQGKIADLEQFRTFASEHGHLTQKGMAAQWHESISDHTISKALRRIGFIRKKRAMAIKSGMKRNSKPS